MRVTLNGDDLETDAVTLTDLFGGAVPVGHAVALNRCVVPRGEAPTTRLAPGDAVELVAAVPGG